MPYWCTDVDFDHAAADAAVTELNRLQRYVDALVQVRDQAVGECRTDWAGRFRDDFDREFSSTQGTLRTVSTDIGDLVSGIQGGSKDASDSQVRRQNARAMCTELDCCPVRNPLGPR
jgi:hypothetical protein